MPLFILLLVLLSVEALSQVNGQRAGAYIFYTSLPATCTPTQGIIAAKIGTPVEYYVCTAANTWTRVDLATGVPLTDGDKGDIVVSGGGGNWQFDAGSILNADINAAAAIALSKLAITGTPDGTKFLRDDGSWQLAPGSVTSVFGRAGAVTAQNGDYTFAQIGSKPTTLAGYSITDAQPLDATLTALAAFNTNGFLVQTAADTFAGRSFADSAEIAWTNPAGAAGNPSAALVNGSIANARLVNSSVTVTAGAGLGSGGAVSLGSSVSLTWDASTFVNSVTLWNSANASRTLTAGLAGATDPVITFSDNSIDVTTGALKVGGTAVLTGNQTITLSGDVSGSGATAITTAIGANKVLDSMLRQSAGVSVIGRSANTTGNVADVTASADGHYLRRASGTLGFGAIAASDLPGSFSGLANPTASLGLVAVNGAATTAMRSDAAPALDQGIAPIWTANHLWNKSGTAASTASQSASRDVRLKGSGWTGAAEQEFEYRLRAAVDTTRDITHTANTGGLTVFQTDAGGTERELFRALFGVTLGAYGDVDVDAGDRYSTILSAPSRWQLNAPTEVALAVGSVLGLRVISTSQVQFGSTGAPVNVALSPRSPAQITADQAAYNPGSAPIWRLSSDAARNIQGITAASDSGTLRLIANVGSTDIVLKHEDAGATAANRITVDTGVDLTLKANQQAWIWYDATSARWRASRHYLDNRDYGDLTVTGTAWTIDNGLAATKLADGSVDNTEFQSLNGVTSALQTQLDGKVPTSRTLTAGVGLSGGGDLSANRTFDLDLAELVNNQTLWDSANATRTLTAGLSGATDPVITFGDSSVDVTTGTLKQGGTAVVLQSRTITIAGTTNQIASSVGAQDLSANRTWTLSLPQDYHTGATPQLARLGLGAAADGTALLYGLKTAIGATSTDGYVLINTTAAAAGAQQYSPRLRLTGQGWKTDATAASQTVDWLLETVPVQGAANPTSYLNFASQVNGGGFSNRVAITSAGYVGIGTTTPATPLEVVGGDITLANNTSYRLKDPGGTGRVFAHIDTSGNAHVGMSSSSAGGNLNLRSLSQNTAIYVQATSGNVGINQTSFPTGGGTPVLSLKDAVSDPTGIPASQSGIYNKGGELYAYDASANYTLNSPHPAALLNQAQPDPAGAVPWGYSSKNAYAGTSIAVNLLDVVRAVERLTGQAFVQVADLATGEQDDWEANETRRTQLRQREIAEWEARRGNPEFANEQRPPDYVRQPEPEYLRRAREQRAAYKQTGSPPVAKKRSSARVLAANEQPGACEEAGEFVLGKQGAADVVWFCTGTGTAQTAVWKRAVLAP